jgi:hypothetical protein
MREGCKVTSPGWITVHKRCYPLWIVTLLAVASSALISETVRRSSSHPSGSEHAAFQGWGSPRVGVDPGHECITLSVDHDSRNCAANETHAATESSAFPDGQVRVDDVDLIEVLLKTYFPSTDLNRSSLEEEAPYQTCSSVIQTSCVRVDTGRALKTKYTFQTGRLRVYTSDWDVRPTEVMFMEPGELAIWDVECQASLMFAPGVDKRMTLQIGATTMSMEKKRVRSRWKATIYVLCVSGEKYVLENGLEEPL